jgi:hypothetical protein
MKPTTIACTIGLGGQQLAYNAWEGKNTLIKQYPILKLEIKHGFY